MEFDGGGGKGFDFAKITENFRLAREQGTPRINLALLRQFWELTTPFWTRRGAWPGYIIVALYTASTFAGSLFSAMTAKYAGGQLDSLSKHDAVTFYKVILASLGIQIASSLISVVFSLPYEHPAETLAVVADEPVHCRIFAGCESLRPQPGADDRQPRRTHRRRHSAVSVLALYLLLRIGAEHLEPGRLWIRPLAFAWYLVPLCAAYYIVTSCDPTVFQQAHHDSGLYGSAS